MPAKADPIKQREFYDKVLHPLMEKAKSGTIALLFLDASHFVMGCDYLGYIYGKKRLFVKTYSGRKRYNVLGAMDYLTKKVLTVTNGTYITATEICDMLRLISDNYSGREVHIILDNAKYQKCRAVQELALELNIRLTYIPPYSPNLNLIERMWKFIKGELRSNYFDNFELFSKKIDSIIDSTTSTNHKRISSLIGEKVQLFDELNYETEQLLSVRQLANDAA